ncbi:MAG: YraN family protein [Actinomycetota bacterium]|nr:YraN family protein [Actinomycetota bacterium]MDP2288386.1 YraN family protein [Actinomycetota bacterium]
MRSSQALGKYGEDLAEEFLKQQGLEILDRNWRCDVGEIDIVARDGHALVICEVKTRSSHQLGSPAEAITVRKLRRLRHLAFRWLEAHQAHVPEVRIDVVCIVQPAWGAAEIEHLRAVGA